MKNTDLDRVGGSGGLAEADAYTQCAGGKNLFKFHSSLHCRCDGRLQLQLNAEGKAVAVGPRIT